MLDAELIAEMLRSRAANGLDPDAPQSVRLTAIGFTDPASAEACTENLVALGLTASMHEERPISPEELRREMDEAGFSYDPNEEFGPLRSWRVAAHGERLQGTVLADLLGRVRSLAEASGGFLCSVAFPD